MHEATVLTASTVTAATSSVSTEWARVIWTTGMGADSLDLPGVQEHTFSHINFILAVHSNSWSNGELERFSV